MSRVNRRKFLRNSLAAGGAVSIGGCDRLSRSEWFPKVLGSAETLSNAAQMRLTPRAALAREYFPGEIAANFRGNGSTDPQAPAYVALAANEFKNYRLEVTGLVNKPLHLSLADLIALPSRTQITRHDCVEGWSAIGQWKGVPLSKVLDLSGRSSSARYVVFRCADSLDGASDYYESIDMQDADHPQTILAYELNGRSLPIANGAPLRVRVERQLGYKMAKYIMQIELVESFAQIEGGKGGYWEDQGYEWYAGI
jgi:DMSO/TMAO reductase YedYZ molybdopterin-dependent catalytic subunit